jgi:hypothetical protein
MIGVNPAAAFNRDWQREGIDDSIIHEATAESTLLERKLTMRSSPSLDAIIVTRTLLFMTSAMAQGAPGGPLAVGVIKAEVRPMTESTEINGRIQARERVDLIARVTAFMNERLFTEGADVKKGELLYRLERAPFLAPSVLSSMQMRFEALAKSAGG